MSAVDGAGRVYRRCACRSEETGRQLGARCPHRTEPGHGRWYFAVMVAGVDGRRGRGGRGGVAPRAGGGRGGGGPPQPPGPPAGGRGRGGRGAVGGWVVAGGAAACA